MSGYISAACVLLSSWCFATLRLQETCWNYTAIQFGVLKAVDVKNARNKCATVGLEMPGFWNRVNFELFVHRYFNTKTYKEIFVNMQYDVTKRQYVWDSGEVVEISLFKSHPHQKVEKKQKICVLLIFHHENLSSYFYRQPCNSIVARQKVIPIMCASWMKSPRCLSISASLSARTSTFMTTTQSKQIKAKRTKKSLQLVKRSEESILTATMVASNPDVSNQLTSNGRANASTINARNTHEKASQTDGLAFQTKRTNSILNTTPQPLENLTSTLAPKTINFSTTTVRTTQSTIANKTSFTNFTFTFFSFEETNTTIDLLSTTAIFTSAFTLLGLVLVVGLINCKKKCAKQKEDVLANSSFKKMLEMKGRDVVDRRSFVLDWLSKQEDYYINVDTPKNVSNDTIFQSTTESLALSHYEVCQTSTGHDLSIEMKKKKNYENFLPSITEPPTVYDTCETHSKHNIGKEAKKTNETITNKARESLISWLKKLNLY